MGIDSEYAATDMLYEYLHQKILSSSTPEMQKLKALYDSPEHLTRMLAKEVVKPQQNSMKTVNFTIHERYARSAGLNGQRLQSEISETVERLTGKKPQCRKIDQEWWIKLGPEAEVIKSLDLSDYPPLQHYKDGKQHLQHLSAVRGMDDISGEHALHYAQRANQRNDVKDTFFPVTALVQQRRYLRLPEAFITNRDDMPELLGKTVEALQAMGIKRMGLLRMGGFSAVYETVPDKDGRVQLVTLMSQHDRYIPHPAFVPAKTVQRIEAGRSHIHIVVSPKLKLEGVTDRHVDKLIRLFNRGGLIQKDLYKHELHDNSCEHHYLTRNVALYEVSPGVEIPVCIDRGAAGFPSEMEAGMTDDMMKSYESRWEREFSLDPELKPYLDMQSRYRGKGLDNVQLVPPPPERYKPLPMTGESHASHALVDKAEKKGMYPVELGSLGGASIRGTQNGQEWVERLNKGIDEFDVTSNPNPPRSK